MAKQDVETLLESVKAVQSLYADETVATGIHIMPFMKEAKKLGIWLTFCCVDDDAGYSWSDLIDDITEYIANSYTNLGR